MTTLAEKIAVMQAFERGEKVEFYVKYSDTWQEVRRPIWDWLCVTYRIAPKPVDLVKVMEYCSGYMGHIPDVMGHKWSDIITWAKELQGSGKMEINDLSLENILHMTQEDHAAEITRLQAEVKRLRERVLAAEYVLKQARPESGYWDTYAKEALK